MGDAEAVRGQHLVDVVAQHYQHQQYLAVEAERGWPGCARSAGSGPATPGSGHGRDPSWTRTATAPPCCGTRQPAPAKFLFPASTVEVAAKIGNVLHPATDVAAAARFSSSGFGTTTSFVDSDRHAALDAGGTRLALAGPDEDITDGIAAVAFKVPDVPTALA
ncbi:hypothetical protein GCM10027445_10460 [Amycolatopsis endophytica]|uniref:Uncharacterized protein n=1 Tax=Amycolatopsis endophytica TaxID=860233 RepID=A0A853AX88_9PSEU|nr:hypothetical protein [Amycolatopsis endophytica]NYI87282.1 hypothetical protein [Amycolatopsis endophytica]